MGRVKKLLLKREDDPFRWIRSSEVEDVAIIIQHLSKVSPITKDGFIEWSTVWDFAKVDKFKNHARLKLILNSIVKKKRHYLLLKPNIPSTLFKLSSTGERFANDVLKVRSDE